MVQGDAYSIDITIQNQGQPLSVEGVELVEVTLLNITRSYPEEVTTLTGNSISPSPSRRPLSSRPCAPCRCVSNSTAGTSSAPVSRWWR